MKINYISNIPFNESSGGISGINTAIYKQFKEDAFYFNYQYINPSPLMPERFISRCQKFLSLPRNYYFFSDQRLNLIKRQFKNDPNSAFFFFLGFTPWIKINPDKPYYCFNDACFATYVDIYNKSDRFRRTELERIFSYESRWLSNAQKVFFGSQWALEETKNIYNLTGENFVNVGIGGFIDIPEKDNYFGDRDFLFIAREFRPKGGAEAVKAFQKARQFHPDINLSIVGEKPDDAFTNLPGVKYQGFFDKNDPQQKRQLKEIFSSSFALVHPTLKDINPLVINELSYFGCPAISSNKFAIPEYILNGKTGLLVNNPRDVDEIFQKMMQLLDDKKAYLKMRAEARLNATTQNTWQKVFSRITQSINESI